MHCRATSVLGISCSVIVLMVFLDVETAIPDKSFSSTGKPPNSIFLNAAPQDGSVFLSWSKQQSDAVNDYDLYWRLVGDTQWSKITVHGEEHQAVSDLSNDRPYEFFVALHGSDVIRSSITRQTPKSRTQCSFPSFFCSYEDATRWLQDGGIDPLSLKCRGHAISSWNIHVPNCYYTDENFQISFLLNRYVDSILTPPSNRMPLQIRSMLIRTLWPDANPFTHPKKFPVQVEKVIPANTGNVTAFYQAYSYALQYNAELSSRITWFIPTQPSIDYAIYHEGHSGSGVDIGSNTINWLLERGVVVVNIDMPLIGANSGNISSHLKTHNDFVRLETDINSPVSLFLLPIKYVVDLIQSDKKSEKNRGKIMMIGRSGGGWTTALYAAIDPRIDIAVPVAGLIPLSMRISSDGPRDLGDYEQNAPHIYDVVTYEDVMKTAGSMAALFMYNAHDPCCFSIDVNSDLVKYLNDASIQLGKTIEVWIDEENNEHSISERGYEVLEDFLKSVQFW